MNSLKKENHRCGKGRERRELTEEVGWVEMKATKKCFQFQQNCKIADILTSCDMQINKQQRQQQHQREKEQNK